MRGPDIGVKMPQQYRYSPGPSSSRMLAGILAACLLLATGAGAQDLAGTTPLDIMDFYVGRVIVPEDSAVAGMDSRYYLDWAVGRRMLRFRGTWVRDGVLSEFVGGVMAWDPVDEVIRINAKFFHGAYFSGVVDVLDAERRVVQRQWTGHYPDGRVVEYRETWTPVDEDRFEWSIEFKRAGEWVTNLPPGVDRTPVHRVIRSNP